MDHIEAVRSNAAERYAIGDLPVGEVEEFERHFFECPQCSEELRALTIFAANAKAVFADEAVAVPAVQPVPEVRRPEPERVILPWWKQPWGFAPALAAIVMGIFAGYQAFVVVPRLESQAGQITPVMGHPLFAASRGEETTITALPNDKFYMVYMDKTWEVDSPSYQAVIQDEAGKTQTPPFQVTAPGPGRAIYLLLPTHALASGRYILLLQGKDAAGNTADLARYPFILRFE